MLRIKITCRKKPEIYLPGLCLVNAVVDIIYILLLLHLAIWYYLDTYNISYEQLSSKNMQFTVFYFSNDAIELAIFSNESLRANLSGTWYLVCLHLDNTSPWLQVFVTSNKRPRASYRANRESRITAHMHAA